MDDTQRYTIGELSRRTGLSVKTIRFYSDSGVVPPTDRTHSGYRLYDVTAMARLELVRTLRELGAGLDEVRRVLAEETTVRRLAEAQLDLLEDQMRLLRTRRAVLRAVVHLNRSTEEVKLMHKLATMSDAERNRIIDDFWDETIGGLEVNEQFAAWMRSAKPELPDDPSTEQVEAWIELAELVGNPDFRATVRRLWEQQAAQQGGGDATPVQTKEEAARWWTLFEDVERAEEAGHSPDSERGRELAEHAAELWARQQGATDGPAARAELADSFGAPYDERLSRYWELLAIINEWPPHPTTERQAHWLADAVRATLP
ncbi:MerR family transcriptional regulator [Saccharopolyspora gloriosae]|uniref:DNA-binding transcriptional MerR regulator n=1 Tax=Saccharopolyspora gloriosae TaxID=455344 RepID=A0A840NSY3_9PSEU|nr:DNA-binding transcriptional MerR regulator [Saccharopolyspora gloriosae]